MIGKWNWTRVGGYDPGPSRQSEATMSTDAGTVAPKPPERYDVRVVLDGDEADSLNYIRAFLTKRTGGAINVTVSDAIRYALKSCAWALQPEEETTNGK